jgi:cell division protease FtsH
VGNISFYDSTGQMDFGFTKPYSEKTAELIDSEVKDIIDESYARALAVLKKNIKGLTELAELLLEKEVIFGEDLERIFGKRKADIKKEAETDRLNSTTDPGKKDTTNGSKPDNKGARNGNKNKSGSEKKEKADRQKAAKK